MKNKIKYYKIIMVSDMRLNNRGWGMMTFIAIVGLLFLLILMIAFLANEFNNGLPTSRKNKELDIVIK